MKPMELLLKAHSAFNFIRRQRVGRTAAEGNTYDLAALMEDFFRERGVQPHTAGWHTKLMEQEDLRQYLIVAGNEDGDSLDLIVTATSRAEAVRLWQGHYQLIFNQPRKVFELPPVATAPRSHPWYGEDDELGDTAQGELREVAA